MRPGANAKSSEGASRFEVLSPNRLKVLRASSKKDLPEHLSVRDAMLAVAKLEGGNLPIPLDPIARSGVTRSRIPEDPNAIGAKRRGESGDYCLTG